MKPVIFSIIAMICYAVANVMLEMKLSKYNNTTLMICISSVIAISAFIFRLFLKTNDASFNFPSDTALILVIILGLIYAVADYFYLGAYTNKGDILTISCITVMFPVFACLLKFSLNKSFPNQWQVAGYILAVAAVLLVTKGSMIK